MKIRKHHPLTGAPIVPLGYRRNGAPIWPILGASEDGDTPPPADDENPPDDEPDGEQEGDEPDGSDSLGDAGKQALDRMKNERNTARREARELRRQLEEATRKPPAEGEAPDPEQIKAEARREVLAEANQRIIRTEVKAAATAANFNDPADALQYLDLASFEVDDDGNVDPDEISDALADLLKKKPYLAAQGGKRFQGGADGGSRNGSREPAQLTEADLGRMTVAEINAARAEGRLNKLLGIS